MNHEPHIALIGDLVASRRLEGQARASVQTSLHAALRELGEQEAEGIAARPLITLGDEFQALLHVSEQGAHATIAMLRDVPRACRPLAVRFGLGVGELSTELRAEAIGMDGPCFHRARKALELARSRRLECWMIAGNPDHDDLWSLLASALLRQRRTWTEPQRAAIDLHERLGSWKAAAQRLGVTQGAVTQRHHAAGWDLYGLVEPALQRGLLQTVSESRWKGAA